MTDKGPKATFMYFAYGSNMLTRRLKTRTPSARRFAWGYIEGRRLNFDKVSKDGSGKCDAELTDLKSDRVYGVIFEISTTEQKALEKVEGVGSGYSKGIVTVQTVRGTVESITFLATTKERALRPYRWYKALTIAGAMEHELPASYIEWLRTVESCEDPNEKRRAENEALLFAS